MPKSDWKYEVVRKPVPHRHTPGMSDALAHLFDVEVDNYVDAVRQGQIVPLDGYHPTLATALDSMQQAPEDVLLGWLGFDEDDEDSDVQAHKVASVLIDFAWLICTFGPDARLTEFLEG